MKFANLSKLGNAIIDIPIKGQDKNRNIESITMLLNAIRISSFKYNDIQIKITAESKKITAPFKVPLLNWKLNRLVNNGIKEMESIN